jgi:hexosaminidase
MKRVLSLCNAGSVALLCASMLTVHTHAQTALPIMPLPAHAIAGTGQFRIDPGFEVVFEGYKEPRLEHARDRFLQNLTRETGILHFPVPSSSTPKFVIRTGGPSAPVQQLGEDEAYHLEIASDHVVLSAANPLGILHGLQTFLQLVTNTPQGFVVSGITIDDTPRFPWRGLMLDAGRHFMPIDTVRQTLDGMEAVKLNVFHWHLSEDQGFRVESRTFPLLQERDLMASTTRRMRFAV